ncbi:hypothetical protein FSARC_13335 [Fusarium sarcochroum]|uniref:Phospholipase/carboxylesterase/thioesterase domain-containing protein n=1 Tax=Fusarium sarcochroum TaxID=1208366 RepID=A0A8H4T1Z8_9HYPO|nr:hypothetical protein FSARC_13335 [Fusarium sarcochroum]
MSQKPDQKTSSAESFGPVYVVEPVTRHTHTAILLHGRGSNGEEFAEELFDETKLSDQSSLAQKLPSWRWVFPSSRELWSTAFQEEMPAWFEAHSLTDTTARQDLQIPGIKESINHIKAILDKEIAMLGGSTQKVVLGGISQGAAVGLWTFLCHGHEKPLGAFFGASTWLLFASNIDNHLVQRKNTGKDGGQAEAKPDEGDVFVADMLAKTKTAMTQVRVGRPFLSTPIFLGHGEDDAYVDVELGRQARDILSNIGFSVEWKEYSGAEQEGHWIKAPEEMDDLLRFLNMYIDM